MAAPTAFHWIYTLTSYGHARPYTSKQAPFFFNTIASSSKAKGVRMLSQRSSTLTVFLQREGPGAMGTSAAGLSLLHHASIASSNSTYNLGATWRVNVRESA